MCIVQLPSVCSFPPSRRGGNRGAWGLEDWRLYWATGVSSDGTVVSGYTFGKNPCGGTLAWVADLNGALPVCYADCDMGCDGKASLDLFDFLCFQNEFAAGHPYADCDGSGDLDLFDFLCFVNAFNEGC